MSECRRGIGWHGHDWECWVREKHILEWAMGDNTKNRAVKGPVGGAGGDVDHIRGGKIRALRQDMGKSAAVWGSSRRNRAIYDKQIIRPPF